MQVLNILTAGSGTQAATGRSSETSAHEAGNGGFASLLDQLLSPLAVPPMPDPVSGDATAEVDTTEASAEDLLVDPEDGAPATTASSTGAANMLVQDQNVLRALRGDQHADTDSGEQTQGSRRGQPGSETSFLRNPRILREVMPEGAGNAENTAEATDGTEQALFSVARHGAGVLQHRLIRPPDAETRTLPGEVLDAADTGRSSVEQAPQRIPPIEALFKSVLNARQMPQDTTLAAALDPDPSETQRPPAPAVPQAPPVTLEAPLRIQTAPAPASPPQSGTPATLQDLGENIVREVRLLQQSEGKAVTLRLHPASLGELKVEMVERNGELAVRLVSASRIVRDALEAQLPLLRESLQREASLPAQVVIAAEPALNLAARQQPQRGHTQPGGDARKRSASSPDQSERESVSSTPSLHEVWRQGSLNVFV